MNKRIVHKVTHLFFIALKIANKVGDILAMNKVGITRHKLLCVQKYKINSTVLYTRIHISLFKRTESRQNMFAGVFFK